MDLRRYFQPVHGDALPDPKGPLSVTIPQQAIAEANKRVQIHSPLPRSHVFTHHCHAVMSSLTTATQSCLRSPLPRSRVFTRHCHAVVSSLATAAQSCLHSPLPRSRVFTCHCRAVVSSLATANGPLRHSSVCVTV